MSPYADDFIVISVPSQIPGRKRCSLVLHVLCVLLPIEALDWTCRVCVDISCICLHKTELLAQINDMMKAKLGREPMVTFTSE